jgi:hypothetical protein
MAVAVDGFVDGFSIGESALMPDATLDRMHQMNQYLSGIDQNIGRRKKPHCAA